MMGETANFPGPFMRRYHPAFISICVAFFWFCAVFSFGCGSVTATSGPASGTGNSGNSGTGSSGSGSSSSGSGGSGNSTADLVEASIGQSTIGLVSPKLLGLSYPKATIMKTYCPFCAASTGIPAKRMIALLTVSGVRHLRIVTDEVGTVITYIPSSPAMNQEENEIGNLDFQNFANFVCAVPELTFSWGINYLNNTPANAAAEASAINQLLGPEGSVCAGRLSGFEIGNEPDSPGYGPAGAASAETFANGWHQYAVAILGAVPTAVLVGPSLGSYRDASTYMPPFFLEDGNLLGVLTEHYYRIGTVAEATIAVITLKAPDPFVTQELGPGLESLSVSGSSIPIEINEGSTVANGGAAGVSNSFASALFAITNAYDLSTAVYGAGALTLDYSSGGAPVYDPTYTQGYSPIIDGPTYTGPNPMLLGITLVSLIGPGDLKPCSLTGQSINLRCYAIASGATTKVVLINQDPAEDAQVTTLFPQPVQNAASILMTAPNLGDTKPDGTIQGSTISSEGTFAPGLPTVQAVASKREVVLQVPAHSAVVIMAQ